MTPTTIYSIRDALGQELWWTTARRKALQLAIDINDIGVGAAIRSAGAGMHVYRSPGTGWPQRASVPHRGVQGDESQAVEVAQNSTVPTRGYPMTTATAPRFISVYDASLARYVVERGEMRVVPSSDEMSRAVDPHGAKRAQQVCDTLNRVYAQGAAT